MARRKTHEEFVAEVKALVGDEYTVVGTYINAKTSIKLRHNKCGHTEYKNPNNFLTKLRGCTKCKGGVRKNDETFLQEFEKVSCGEYALISDYISAHSYILVKHLSCGEPYKITANSFLSGTKCARCQGKGRKTLNYFSQEIEKLTCGEYTVIGEYISAKDYITMKHNNCGHEYEVCPTNFLAGNRCPACAESKGEKTVAMFLKENGIPYKAQSQLRYQNNKRPLRFDFFVHGVAIEYDGIQHFEPVDHFGGVKGFLDTKRRDAIKTQYCADNGIPLIRIPYWDFDNIDAILTEKLLPLLKEQAA